MFKIDFVLFSCVVISFYLFSNSVVFSQGNIGNEVVTCNSTSCKDVNCSSLPKNCQIQNKTHNGVFLPSPETCNCCDYCLVNIEEGGGCTVGTPSNAQHTSICGPRLMCVPTRANDSDGTCQKMDTECMNLQGEFDARRKNGSLGFLEVRPRCDDDGLYDTYKCIPGQTCYCQLKNGSRIFGEGDFYNIDSYMPCACSRKYYEIADLLGYELNPLQHFRCDSMGNYDRIQCIRDKCLCVDTLDGAPTYPERSLVNMSLISNKTLKGCYLSKIEGEYYKPCEKEYVQVFNKSEEQRLGGFSGVTGFKYPKCDLDGSYQAVQENTTHKYCVDKEGEILAILDKKQDATLANDMNCKCLRANLVTSTKEKPDCLRNGNYNPVQCRRGTCYCVDFNGNQVCKDANQPCEEIEENLKETLSCYVAKLDLFVRKEL